MKRAGKLWETLTSLPHLFASAHAAARGKRLRPDVAAFLLDLEPELLALRRELLAGAYRPGPYRTFVVREPKQRLISAAPFRDRVVHHALTGVLEPVFERRFSADSYACRRGFGTHRALARVRDGCRRFRFALRCDVRKFFASVDHAVLMRLLARGVKCRRTLELAARIVDGANPQEDVFACFPGDDLFTPFERRKGLPLGNQTSQFFANVVLNPLDHFVRRELRPGDYVRYVDDFVLFDDDKNALAAMRTRIQLRLDELRLRIHRGKSRVYRTRDGVGWLGFRVFPGFARLARANVVATRRRLARLQRLYAAGAIGGEDLDARVRAWVAHAAHGDTRRLRERMFSEYTFSRSVA